MRHVNLRCQAVSSAYLQLDSPYARKHNTALNLIPNSSVNRKLQPPLPEAPGQPDSILTERGFETYLT